MTQDTLGSREKRSAAYMIKPVTVSAVATNKLQVYNGYAVHEPLVFRHYPTTKHI